MKQRGISNKQHAGLRAVACMVLAGLTGCSKHEAVSTQRRAGPLPTQAGLSVEVVPATGITLGLDGNKVASQTPFTTLELEPGAHTLLVRGMGYLPVEMPVTLQAGQTLKVAVSLRARPLQDAEPPEPPPPPSPPRRPVAERNTASGRAAPPPEIGVELPPGAAPVTLAVISQPEAPVAVDDEAATGKTLSLHHTYGILVVGTLKIRYAITADRALEFTLPDDTATWQRDTLDVSAGTVMRFTHGVTRLRRLGTDGEQSVVLRRVDY